MKIEINIEKRHVIILAIILFILSLVPLIIATVSHPPDEIAPGTFATGVTYIFPENIQVDGNIYLPQAGVAGSYLIDPATNKIDEDILPY